MIDVVSVDTMRKSDASAVAGGVPGRILMQRAGHGIYENVRWTGPVAIVCGSGNNAGDGYVIASLLNDSSIQCTLFLLFDKFSDDGMYYYEKCVQKGIEVRHFDENTSLSGFKTVVDCIYGTGFKGEVTDVSALAVDAINKSGAYVVSVDINSGLNGDNGLSKLCVKSDITVSIGTFKTGHFLNMAKDMIKEKINCDIGIAQVEKTYKLLEEKDLTSLFSQRLNFSNKGTYGYAAIIGGSEKYSGALRLACMANAAMRSGAGVVKAATKASVCTAVMPLVLETTLFPLSERNGSLCFVKDEIEDLIKNTKTVAFGMGIEMSDGAIEVLVYLLKHYKGTLLIDADGLNMLSLLDKKLLRRSKAKIVLTPHAKEFSRLVNTDVETVLSKPVELAIDFAKENKVIVLLKGPTTVITDGKDVYLVDKGCPGMATAGSGDVLSGIATALCSYCPDTLFAVAASAFVNGRAGEIAMSKVNPVSMIASDTVNAIAMTISEIMSIS